MSFISCCLIAAGTVTSPSAFAVYDEFESAEALAYMDLHELTGFIIEKGRNRFPDPDAVARVIQKAARSSYRLPKMVNDSVNQILSISITAMKALESQIREFDKVIAAQMELLPSVLVSIPGISPVYSAGIMGISIVLKIRLHLRNMQVLHGTSTSLVILKHKLQNSSDPVAGF